MVEALSVFLVIGAVARRSNWREVLVCLVYREQSPRVNMSPDNFL